MHWKNLNENKISKMKQYLQIRIVRDTKYFIEAKRSDWRERSCFKMKKDLILKKRLIVIVLNYKTHTVLSNILIRCVFICVCIHIYIYDSKINLKVFIINFMQKSNL